MIRNEYIWNCPRDRCGAIVLKTTKPFIMDGVFMCKHCNCKFTADDLMKANLKNLEKYIKDKKRT